MSIEIIPDNSSREQITDQLSKKVSDAINEGLVTKEEIINSLQNKLKNLSSKPHACTCEVPCKNCNCK